MFTPSLFLRVSGQEGDNGPNFSSTRVAFSVAAGREGGNWLSSSSGHSSYHYRTKPRDRGVNGGSLCIYVYLMLRADCQTVTLQVPSACATYWLSPIEVLGIRATAWISIKGGKAIAFIRVIIVMTSSHDSNREKEGGLYTNLKFVITCVSPSLDFLGCVFDPFAMG